MMSSSVVNASYAHAPQGAAPSLHTQPGHHRPPGIMQKPGIPAQQMQRKGKREWACGSGTGQNPLAHQRPATSQHRVGRGAGEAAAHLACESVLEGFRQRKLRCRYFATRGWGLLSSSLAAEVGPITPLKTETCGRSSAARKERYTNNAGTSSLVRKLYRQQVRATSKVRGAPPPPA